MSIDHDDPMLEQALIRRGAELSRDLELPDLHAMVLTATEPEQSRRRWVWPLLAAVLLLAIPLITVIALHKRPHAARPAIPQPSSTWQPIIGPGKNVPGDLSLHLAFAPVAGCTVDAGWLARGWEMGSFDCRTSDVGGEVIFYDQGGFTPPADSTPVAGHPRYRLTQLTTPDDYSSNQAVLAIFWQYAPNSWAVVFSDRVGPSPSAAGLATMIKFADAARYQPRPALAPIKLNQPGLYVYATDFDSTGGAVALSHLPVRHTSVKYQGDAYDIYYNIGSNPQTHRFTQDLAGGVGAAGPVTPTKINGQSWLIDDFMGLIVLKKPGFQLAIEAYGPAGGDRPSRAALMNFVSSITVASDPGDENTWFPVTDVVPAG